MEGNTPVILTKDQIKELIKDTVLDTMTKLGIEQEKPLEMQKDFQMLREFRTSAETIKRKGMMIAFSCVVSGIIAACWMSFKAVIKI